MPVLPALAAPPPTPPGQAFVRFIHLLYVPTLCCNLSCSYCYLGRQTTEAKLQTDAARAVATLEHALQALEQAGVLAFNVSLHGGEVTTLPAPVLEQLLEVIERHYHRHFDALQAQGHRKSAPHIKTNLVRFAPLYTLLERHKVSISASIDLPLALHAAHRTTLAGTSWLDRTLENLRLLARYPHGKKISATLSSVHLENVQALVDDIWFLHRDIGFDMNQLNLMFAFGSALNRTAKGDGALAPATEAQQQQLYAALKSAFMGTELQEGLQRHWFEEFKPGYCTNCVNCGERFYLLQSDGAVYSCVRGQGIPEFHYGNVWQDSIASILETGMHKIALQHANHGLDAACQRCAHLSRCNTGCAVVKFQRGAARSYTCALQHDLYADQPLSYPPDDAAQQQAYLAQYRQTMHPSLAFAAPAAPPPAPGLVLPNDLGEPKNTLAALIAADATLGQLFRNDAFVLELGAQCVPLESQLRKTRRSVYTLVPGDRVVLHLRRELLQVAIAEPIRNTLYLQLLRDTPVVYGDEQRTKQEHLFTYQLYANCLQDSERLGADYVQCDVGALLALHGTLFLRGVLNNLFVTTSALRDYHYQKQRNNAFYHLQTANLPFQNFEFHYLPPLPPSPSSPSPPPAHHDHA